MRLTLPKVTLIRPDMPPLVFDGARGERFQISVLEDDVIRVQLIDSNNFAQGIRELG